ncbi:probable isoaspartyl peptidase/L-asparaginase GA20639 [Contarinia nasturtii]|uniref:probable isoaspartyl peptidase/L-asparaginase GA20639 n=1 Tax=Contarinia nasturtii TaxID=265458 RepID=UPI0012D410AD|nr:probable isoaspartyl peptidase/L-asparaginase GA20639 [Contarinia nasturtii]
MSFHFSILSVILSLHLFVLALNAKTNMSIVPIVLVHGGAGNIPDSRDHGKLVGCKLALKLGYEKLESGGSVLEAVEEAVRSMELDEYFNAGYGSVLNYDGDVEMEASIMNGSNLKAGCCTLVQDIYHPITLAKDVMLKTNHTFLGGVSVMKFAREQGFEILPPGSLVTEYAKEALEEYKRRHKLGLDVTNAPTEIGDRRKIGDEVGTVGAVAIDSDGNVAAATSTGGITGKLPGRIGDTPILGSGTYADNLVGAVSTTGHGESIMRYNVAQRILQRMLHLKESAQNATEITLLEMTERVSYSAGAITLDTKGDVGISFTSKKMAWAYRKGNKIHSGIRHGDNFIEDA